MMNYQDLDVLLLGMQSIRFLETIMHAISLILKAFYLTKYAEHYVHILQCPSVDHSLNL